MIFHFELFPPKTAVSSAYPKGSQDIQGQPALSRFLKYPVRLHIAQTYKKGSNPNDCYPFYHTLNSCFIVVLVRSGPSVPSPVSLTGS